MRNIEDPRLVAAREMVSAYGVSTRRLATEMGFKDHSSIQRWLNGEFSPRNNKHLDLLVATLENMVQGQVARAEVRSVPVFGGALSDDFPMLFHLKSELRVLKIVDWGTGGARYAIEVPDASMSPLIPFNSIVIPMPLNRPPRAGDVLIVKRGTLYAIRNYRGVGRDARLQSEMPGDYPDMPFRGFEIEGIVWQIIEEYADLGSRSVREFWHGLSRTPK